MRRILLPFVAILAFGMTIAGAQNLTKSLQGSQDPRGPVPMDSNNNIYLPYHLNSVGQFTPPTITAGGAGGAPTFVGTATDLAGVVTIPSSTTTLIVTFGQAFTNAPSCILQELAGTTAPTFTVATTSINATVVAASKSYDYICLGANY